MFQVVKGFAFFKGCLPTWWEGKTWTMPHKNVCGLKIFEWATGRKWPTKI